MLFLLTVCSFSIFGYKECNQFDFSIDHLVMSMCKVISCVLEKGFFYDQCIHLAELVSLCPASFNTPRLNFPVIPGCLLTSHFYIPNPCDEKGIFFSFSVNSRRCCVFKELVNFTFSISSRGIGLDYNDIE